VVPERQTWDGNASEGPVYSTWRCRHVGMDTEAMLKCLIRTCIACAKLKRGPSLLCAINRIRLFERDKLASNFYSSKRSGTTAIFQGVGYTTETTAAPAFFSCPKGFRSRPSDFAKVSNSDDLLSSTATSNPPLVCGSARTAFCSSVITVTFFP
jgi:hypothetical protein